MKLTNKESKSEGKFFTISGALMLISSAIPPYNHWILNAISGFCGLYCLIYGVRVLKALKNDKKDGNNVKEDN